MEEVTIVVEIYKPNMMQTLEHKKWFDDAFGKDRNIMSLQFDYFVEKIDKKKVEKLPDFSVVVNYEMFKELK